MVHLKLLGGAIVEDESGVATGATSGRYPLAILALLATAPFRTLGRGKLVGLLWPDSPEEKGRNRLNTYLHRIRSELGEGVVVSVGDDIRLDPEALACDVWEFEAALESGDHERAAEVYEGSFLDGFRLSGSPEFDHWLDRERSRLREAYREALEALAERAEGRGEPATALRWWRKRADDDPYDSRVVRRLMEALAAAGNRAEALRAARVHVELLRGELGVKPDPDLLELMERLKREPTAVPASRGASAGEAPARDASDAVAHQPEPAARPADDTDGTPTERDRPRRWTAVAAAVVLLAVAAAVWAWTRGEDPLPGTDPHTVAVLPFEAVSEGQRDPVTEGLHADLLTRLSNVASLKVVSGTSVQRYRRAGLSAPEIARELGARWLVEGSVQRAGSEIQVNAQLIDGPADTHVWARTYRRELTAANLFDLQAELTAAIARALEARVTESEAARVASVPTRDLEAYRLYVEGRRALGARTSEGVAAAVEHFRRAIERDSAYALAWAGLADALGLSAGYGYSPPAGLPDQREAARRAVELEPDLAEAQTALGYVAIRELDAPPARRALERAVALKPSYAQAQHWLGYVLALGPLDRAREHVALSLELNPELVPARGTLAWIHLATGEPERALAEARLALRALPEGSLPARQARRDEAIALYHMGRFEEVERRSRNAAASMEERLPYFDVLLVMTAAARGETALARERLERGLEADWPPVLAGLVHAALGEPDAAFAAFEEQSGWGMGLVLALRCWFPDVLNPLRQDPRYERILGEVYRSWELEPGAWSVDGTLGCGSG